MTLPIDFAWLQTLGLAAVRFTAFLVIAPPFSSPAFPARIKAMLGVGLALAVTGRIQRAGEIDAVTLITGLALEAATGFALGFLVSVIFSAVQAAGSLIDVFSGFQLAQVYDPQTAVNGAQFTRLMQMTALALLIASDGYQLVLTGLTGSFGALPVAGGLDLTRPVEAMTNAVGGMLVAAVQIAGPLVVVLFLADVGLGLLTRVAPALNAFSLGFPLKTMLTLALGSILFLALPRVVSALAGDAAQALTGVG
ncbi:flagellar biosynthetic protein FliR [Tersicoccus solisilvae]|uniref:Flagellar biosynthetic protein FliR n=1 Tax=Tersicoccus solisilvae TaxID=1882339 RepID=A0ABQ1PPP5_9MICC|nr:flagellar biosynthetic protein FliR [Tersicoccus solisilvae]GGD00424.1 flagellar biosynthetic protein FliR [Tersicoccus solisilvae]